MSTTAPLFLRVDAYTRVRTCPSGCRCRHVSSRLNRQITSIEDFAVQNVYFQTASESCRMIIWIERNLELSDRSAGDSAGRFRTTWWVCGFVLFRNRLPSLRVPLRNSNSYPLKQASGYLESCRESRQSKELGKIWENEGKNANRDTRVSSVRSEVFGEAR